MRRFALFCVSGGLAFAIDAGLTQAWSSLAGLDPWSARALAVPPAVAFSWWFNRRVTFRAARDGRDGPLWREGLLYAGTQLAGLVVNLACYALLVTAWATAARWPALAVAAGAIAGLAVTWGGARHLVFRGRG